MRAERPAADSRRPTTAIARSFNSGGSCTRPGSSTSRPSSSRTPRIEELRSANEEILSSNEELQSTNEELETAKEELQSVNEELTTVNEQLQNRNVELNRLNDDLANFLGSGNVPMVVVGVDLRIRRFTPAAGKVLNLLPTDVGRPVGDLRPPVEVPDLEDVAREGDRDRADRGARSPGPGRPLVSASPPSLPDRGSQDRRRGHGAVRHRRGQACP